MTSATPATSCAICRGRLHRNRCRICQKGEIPKPGSRPWVRWTRGIRVTVRQRLASEGLSWLAMDVESAIIGGGLVPVAAARHLADILALPISPEAYARALERAALYHQAYAAVRAAGATSEDADQIAAETADELIRRRYTRERFAAEPDDHRVRIAGDSDSEAAAELEAAAADEAMTRRARRRIE